MLALVWNSIRLGDIYHLARSMMSGKTFALPTGWWPHEASRRLAILCVTTVALLFARLQIMGSQLPVFTRYANAEKLITSVREKVSIDRAGYQSVIRYWFVTVTGNGTFHMIPYKLHDIVTTAMSG
uniref:Uncharacterized protein n=1 Tax=Anopheles culicifacies TaxID=139723 RepID=A0A182MBI3_9DIPT